MSDAEQENRGPTCPICGGEVEPSAETHPFCSRRCRLIDLGNWLDESYVVSRPLEQRDFEEGD